MTQQPNPRHLAREADRVADVSGRHQIREGLIPRDELIESVPRHLFSAPSFLTRTGTKHQFDELQELLRRLWEVNEEHVGENTLEVQVYYLMTREAETLQEGFLAWVEAYFTGRSDRSNLNPRVQNDTFLLFEKLLGECQSILGKFNGMKKTLNSTFLEPVIKYTAWLLYARLWRDRVRIEGRYFIADPPPVDLDAAQRMTSFLFGSGWEHRSLKEFLGRIREKFVTAQVEVIAREPERTIRERLQAMADDIQQMRPFLARGFKPHKTILSLADGVEAAWEWWVSGGIGRLIVGATADEVQNILATRESPLDILVEYDGVLADARAPWAPGGRSRGCDELALNFIVLERFHDRLFSFYDKIDFDSINRTNAENLGEDESTATIPEERDAAVAASCRLLAMANGEDGARRKAGECSSPRAIPRLREQQLLRFLSQRFGCEVRQGKGSEVVIYRPGAKSFTLKHHKRNPEVSPGMMPLLLKRLGIAVEEFVRAVDR